MLAATKTLRAPRDPDDIRAELRALCAEFGVRHQALAEWMGETLTNENADVQSATGGATQQRQRVPSLMAPGVARRDASGARAPPRRAAATMVAAGVSDGVTTARHTTTSRATPRAALTSQPATRHDLEIAISAETLASNEAMHAAAVAASEARYLAVSSFESSELAELPLEIFLPTRWRRYAFPPPAAYTGADATPPHPFGRDDLALVSLTPLLTRGVRRHHQRS